MEILVCARRVPDTSENEIALNSAGNDIERDELVYSVNEPDNYAVEEALQIVAKAGGNVTVVTAGSDEDEEILRREMAMGAQHGVLLSDSAFSGSDGRGIASILKAFVAKGDYDLILTGVQAEDGAAQVGGMLAAMLDYSFASLVNSIEVLEGKKLKICREIEGGNKKSARSIFCVLDSDRHQRATLRRHARHSPSLPCSFQPWAADPGVDRRVGDAGASEACGLLCLRLKGARCSRESRGKHRPAGGISGGQRRAEVMPRIFNYIIHRGGVVEDSAAELLAAARKIDLTTAPTAVVIGCGPELDGVCESLRPSYAEVWKLAHENLAYPNAELIRKALVKVLPPNSIVLVPHDHFGIDLAPGLSIKLNAAFVSDVVEIESVEGAALKAVRQEFGGQVSAHVRCDLSSGAVVTVRPGAFKIVESAFGSWSISRVRSALTSSRRYLQTVVSEAGDVDITKHAGVRGSRHSGTGQPSHR